MLTPDGLANDLGGFLGPHERRGVIVPLLDVAADVLDERPDAYFQLLSTMRRMFTHRWERRARTCDLPGAETRQATVCSCHASLYEGWRFCPLCGSVVVA